VAIPFPLPTQFHSRHEIGGLHRLRPTTGTSRVSDLQAPPRAARILKRHAVSDLQALQPGPRDGKAGVGARRRRLRRVTVGEPHSRWRCHATEEIPLRADFRHGRARLDGPGPQFGAGQIHQDLAADPDGRLGTPEVLDHPHPPCSVVVRAVDPHAVHALLDEIVHETVVVGGLARHRDHDPNSATMRRSPEELFRLFGEQVVACLEVGSRAVRSRPLLPLQGMQRADHGVKARKDVSLRAAER
jgi:hypothetical protein